MNLLYTEALRADGPEETPKERPPKYERKTLRRAYGRSKDCSKHLEQTGDDPYLRGRYCNARWCVTCNRIRTAKAILTYEPFLQEIGREAYFVTMTLENCEGDELRKTLVDMQAAFFSCVRSIKRTDKLSFRAIRKTEVTYNAKTGQYHPHYHVIVEGEHQAYLLLSYWMKRSPRKVDRKGQDVRPLDEKGLKEIMKYSTKVITSTKDGERSVHAPSLHRIYTALKGTKTLQPFGFRPKKDFETDQGEDEDELILKRSVRAFKQIGLPVLWEWLPDDHDWVDMQTGELLSEYEPSPEMARLISKMRGIEPPPDGPPDTP